MDFSVLLQLRNKKFWWMDVIFYFVISALLATIICYCIFLAKNNMLASNIQYEDGQLLKVGTLQQKEYEQEVLNYKSKIIDFTTLVNNHQFASNGFAFMQAQTMPNVWFKQFGLDEQGASIQLSGEADSMDTYSRQVNVFEKNKYVKSVGSVNSSVGSGGKVEFNLSLTLDHSIFNYIADNPVANPKPTPVNLTTLTSLPSVVATSSPSNSAVTSNQPASGVALITSFRLPLSPVVIGSIDQKNYVITLNVPYGTNLKGLVPEIIFSPGDVLAPASSNPQDFSNSIIYTVSAPGVTPQAYKVITTVLPGPTEPSSNNSNPGLIETIIIVAVLLAVILAVLIFTLLKLRKSKPQTQI